MTPKQFRSLRHQLGMSQTKLALILGVNVRQIKRWEAGDSPISGPVVLAMQYLEYVYPASNTTPTTFATVTIPAGAMGPDDLLWVVKSHDSSTDS